MRQDTRVAATTDTRRWLHVLRPFLLLGGFVVVWWCLATGTAQAAEGSQQDLRTTTQALGATVHQAVEHHSAPVRQTVHHHVAPVRATVAPVRATVVETATKTVAETPAKSVLEPVTHVVRSAVAPVVHTTRAALSKTPVAPVVEHVPPVVQPKESATRPGDAASVAPRAAQHTSAPAATLVEDPSTTPSTTPSTVPPTSARDARSVAAPSLPGTPDHDAPAFLPSAGTGASAAQGGSGSGPGAAVCETRTTPASPTTKTSIDAPAGRPSAGPAYEPSSSPD